MTVTMPAHVIRAQLMPDGVELVAATISDPAAKVWRVPADTWREAYRWHRRPEPVDADYDPELHRYQGRCCS